MVRYKETKDFFKIKFRIKEADEEVKDDDAINEIQELIKVLKDDNFGNAEKRKEFVKIVSQIALSNDPEARKVIKALGNFMSTYQISDVEIDVDAEGNAELEIKAKKEEGIMKKKISFKSKHMKEMYADMMDDLGYEVVDDAFPEDDFSDEGGFSNDFVEDEFVDDFSDDFSDEEESFSDDFSDDFSDEEESFSDDFSDDLSGDEFFDDDDEFFVEKRKK